MNNSLTPSAVLTQAYLESPLSPKFAILQMELGHYYDNSTIQNESIIALFGIRSELIKPANSVSDFEKVKGVYEFLVAEIYEDFNKVPINEIPKKDLIEYLLDKKGPKPINRDEFFSDLLYFDRFEGLHRALYKNLDPYYNINSLLERNSFREVALNGSDSKVNASRHFILGVFKDLANVLKYEKNKIKSEGSEYKNFDTDEFEQMKKIELATSKLKDIYWLALNPIFIQLYKVKANLIEGAVDYLENKAPKILSLNNKILEPTKYEELKMGKLNKTFSDALGIVFERRGVDKESPEAQKMLSNVSLAVEGYFKMNSLRRNIISR